MNFDHEYYMRAALREAYNAYDEKEVPVGAVAVNPEGRIISRAYNQVETLKDATAHAEILLITQVENYLSDWRLENITIYVTKEPCAMCAGAMVNARVKKLIFGVSDPREGAAGSALNILAFKGMLHNVQVGSGVLESECREIIRDFFRKVRSSGLEKP